MNSTYYFSFWEEIQKRAKKKGIMFLRWDPLYPRQKKEKRVVKSIDIQPSRTLVLDLTSSEGELMADMHQKTRYNIRLAFRKGVKVREAKGGEDLEEFWRIMEDTARRDGFRLHPKQHYERMLETDPEMLRLFLAEYDGRVVAGNIVSFFGDTVTYVHGASDIEYRKVMAPYALQWHSMEKGKEWGYKYYDLYGIDKNKWPGVTRFKKGFGGREVELPGTYDIIFQAGWYKVYDLLRRVRRRM